MKKLTGIKEKRIIHIGTQMSDNRSIVILHHIEMNIFIKQRENFHKGKVIFLREMSF